MLLLAISVSRVSFFWGMVAATLAVMVYGAHVAFLHSEHLEIQRLSRVSTRRLQRQVARDPLTGIANRVGLAARLRELDGGQDCSLLMIDIDFFRQFNDSHGHVVGDACLPGGGGHRVGPCLAGAARHSGALRRRGVRRGAAGHRGRRRHRRRAAPAGGDRAAAGPHPASPMGVVTVSIGIATRPATADAAIELLHHADVALYRAKRKGRNGCVHARDTDQRSSIEAMPL